MYKYDLLLRLYLCNEIHSDSFIWNGLQTVVFRHCRAISDKDLVLDIRAGIVPTLQEEKQPSQARHC